MGLDLVSAFCKKGTKITINKIFDHGCSSTEKLKVYPIGLPWWILGFITLLITQLKPRTYGTVETMDLDCILFNNFCAASKGNADKEVKLKVLKLSK